MRPTLQSRLALLGTAAGLALTACSSAGAPAAPQGSSAVPATASSPASAQPSASPSATTPSATATGSPATSTPSASAPAAGGASARPITGREPVTVSFIGDVHFEKKLAAVAEDPQGMAALKPYLAKADLTVANLETAITDGPGSPQPDKQFIFHAPSSALDTMANAGIDIAGMANNHAGDYDDAGVLDTLRARQSAPLTLMGIGKNAAEANAPVVRTVDGVSIALLNASSLWEKTTEFHTASDTHPGIATDTPEQPEAKARFLASVKDATAKYDVVIAFLHYGTELEKCAQPKQFTSEAALKSLGVDAVIGAHSHRVQAGGWDGKTYVNYGLGSFTWWMQGPDPATGVLTVSIDKDAVKAKREARATGVAAPKAVISQEKWQAMWIGKSGLPYVPEQDVVDEMNAERDSYRGCSRLSATPDGPVSSASPSPSKDQ